MNGSDDVISLSEALDRFAGQWLALAVVARDKDGTPLRVRVLANAGTRLEVRDKVLGLADAYITFAGPAVPEGQGALYICSRLERRPVCGK